MIQSIAYKYVPCIFLPLSRSFSLFFQKRKERGEAIVYSIKQLKQNGRRKLWRFSPTTLLKWVVWYTQYTQHTIHTIHTLHTQWTHYLPPQRQSFPQPSSFSPVSFRLPCSSSTVQLPTTHQEVVLQIRDTCTCSTSQSIPLINSLNSINQIQPDASVLYTLYRFDLIYPTLCLRKERKNEKKKKRKKSGIDIQK